MRRSLSIWAPCLLASFLAAPGYADPLRLVPAEADFLIKVERPGQLVRNVYNLEPIRQLQELELVRNLFDSPDGRRFEQIVRYLEKKLGRERYDLVDELSSGGLVVAGKVVDSDTAVILAVLQSKDDKLLRDFFQLALELAEQEATREGKAFTMQKSKYRKHEILNFGEKLHIALASGALLAASHPKALTAALDCLDGRAKNLTSVASLSAARRHLGANPAAWGWANLESLRKIPEVQKGFDEADDDFNVLFFGPMMDIAGRSPFLCAGLYQNEREILLSFRMPRGRDGMQQAAALLVPPVGKASLPLLEPKGVLFSSSYFLDLKALWDNRATLLKEDQLKQLEDFDRTSGTVLFGTKLSTLLQQAGAYQRLVVAQTAQQTYKKEAKTPLPSFALVVDMRDPAFGKSLEAVLRGAALLGNVQFNVKMVEEDRAGAKLVSYRFDEEHEIKDDPEGLRFNFSPCFATVNNQFFVSSSVELGRELIDLISKEDGKQFSDEERSRVYASGAATLLRAFEDQLLTQAVLAQALDAQSARRQLDAAFRILESLGVIENNSYIGNDRFRYDLRLNMKAAAPAR